MLISSKNGLAFNVLPGTPDERSHQGWMPYTLSFSKFPDGSPVIFGKDGGLFFDDAVDPEVPKLVDGIRSVLKGTSHYRFEPVDERDFSFELNVVNGIIYCSIVLLDFVVEDDLSWISGLEVNAIELDFFCKKLIEDFKMNRGDSA